MHVQSPPRLLKPVASSMRADGAPYVRLSPHKGMRNASIIYEAIRNLPDSTAIRGDFDKHSYPLAYFPAHSRKIVGTSPGARAINARNIEADRKEFASFLSSIADATYRSKASGKEIVKACFQLRNAVLSHDENSREFRVGDIREPLRVIARAYTRRNVPAQHSPLQTATRRASARQLKQLEGFIHISPDTFRRLVAVLPPGRNEKYDISTDLAITEMRLVLKAFRQSQSTGKMNFADFLRRQGVSPYLQTFAVRWLRESIPRQSVARSQLNDLPWAAELDDLCKLIIREYRRTSRIRLSDGCEAEGYSLIYRRGANLASRPVSQSSNVPARSAAPPQSPMPTQRLPASPVFTPVSAVSPGKLDTPDDEKALWRVISQSAALPRFDIDRDIDAEPSPDSLTEIQSDDSSYVTSSLDADHSASAEPIDGDAADEALTAMLSELLQAPGVTVDSIPLPTRDSGLLDLLGTESLRSESSIAEHIDSVADIDRNPATSS